MKFTILGCGSSMGVPRPDGFFGNCDPKNKKNYRTRCSALIQTSDENILIDTSPDLRQQLLRHKIKKINRVLFSHMHGDQTHGINELRVFYLKNKKKLDIFADSCRSGKTSVLSAENGNEAVACVYAALSSIERNGAGVKLSEVVEAASKK